MKEDQIRRLRYQLGEIMGDYAPEYFRPRRSLMTEIMVGAGSIVVAVGIGYIAMRLADRRFSDLIERVMPSIAAMNGRQRPMAHGTSGAEMPDRTERRRARGSMARTTSPSTDGSE